MTAPRFVVIGNPGNRRVRLFQQALRDSDLPTAEVWSYEELLRGSAEEIASASPGVIHRLESPGENPAVELALIRRGFHAEQRAGRLGPGCKVPDEILHGQIVAPGLWYAGYRHLLQNLWPDEQRCCWMTPPSDVLRMFAKSDCQQLMEQHGIPVPRCIGRVEGYDHLRSEMETQRLRQVFVKLEHGSSASGVIALRIGSRVCEATTSVEMVRQHAELLLFNSLRLQRYRDESEIAALINALAPHGLFAEQWVPKAGFHGRTFDLRIVLIGGEVRHTVMRTSRSPLTNLHLGNQRGDVRGLLQQLPTAARHTAWESCRKVAEIFPRSTAVGIDLGFTPGWKRHVIFEVNAFGDLLPGVIDRGQNTYQAAIACCLRRVTSIENPPITESGSSI